MALDLREHIQLPRQWEWIAHEQQRLGGEDAFYNIRNAMLLALSKIPQGKWFDIEKSVKAENRPMFIKIACEWMQLKSGQNYEFNRLMNKITHEKPFESTIKNEEKK